MKGMPDADPNINGNHRTNTMRRINSIALVSALGLVLSSFNTRAQQRDSKEGNVKLTVLNSMERIGQDEAIFGATSAKIKAARNEVESFQVVVHSPEKNIAVVKVEVSDLTGKSGTIKKENAALFREEYTRVRLSTPRAALPPGLYADPLVPFINPLTGKPIEPRSQSRSEPGGPVITRGFEMYAVPFEVWKGQNQPLWIDISVPKDAAPGDYKGTVNITVYDGALGDIPKNDGVMFPGAKTIEEPGRETVFSVEISLTVWDFTLPDGPTHRNNFGDVQRVAKIFGLDRNSSEFHDIELNYCRMMADNRINPPIPDRFLPEMNENGSLKITAARTEALKKFIADFHVTDFPVPADVLREVRNSKPEKVVRYYKEMFQYLKDNGWDKRAYLYMVDEPNDKQSYERVIALGKLVHEGAPGLKCLVVEQPYPQNTAWPDIDPAVDIWCPLFSFIGREQIDQKLAHGDEVWSYTALAQRAPEYYPKYNEVKDFDPPYWAIDQPLTSFRIPTWINLQYRINGYLYWTTDYSDKSVTGVMDPWFLPIYSASGNHFSGEGYLLYPGLPCGINGPVASIRLKNVRDSMEDYEYFALLGQSGGDAATRIVSTIVPNWWAKPTAADFMAAREKMANEIVKLKK
jgi:hypothetical protein